MRKLQIAALAALLLPVACSGSSSSSGSPTPQPTNAIAFPLMDGSSVLGSRAFHQVVTAQSKTDLLAQGAGTYDGHEVVAGTLAVTPALETWLHDVAAHPPAGYTAVAGGDTLESIRSRTRDVGLDFQIFQNTVDGKPHGVFVMIVDTKTLDQKAGPILGMLPKIRMLPPALRDPLDAQAKKLTGFTATEMTEPDTPIGAVFESLDQLRTFGGRGIILIDAVKQQ